MKRRLAKVLWFGWKYWLGVLFCQIPPASFLVVGWTYRAMQRTAFRRWCSLAGREPGEQPWPNWIVHAEFRRTLKEGEGGIVRRGASAFGHSLWQNLRLGVQGVFNTWVLTWPACILWLFSWYAGWNNSFFKGYEQAWVGPATGLFGALLFIAAMLYVPMAQARQAVTGEWRAFYQFTLVWALVRRRAFSSLTLAGLYAAVSLPVYVLKTLPVFLGNQHSGLQGLSELEAFRFLDKYFFYASFGVLAAFVFLRLAAARIYAAGLAEAVRAGDVPIERLGAVERERMGELGLLNVERPAAGNAVLEALGWAGTRTGRVAAGGATALLWFTVVAQIFISGFFNYHPRIGWMNQPLVHLPYFRYIPGRIERARHAESAVPR